MTTIKLNNTNILSHYFTKSNFINFKDWYKSIDLLTNIHNELDNLTTTIENLKWIEDDLRMKTFEKIRLVLINHIIEKFKKEPEEIYNDWIKSIQPYCFQGGKGYKINYSGTIPHHWCIKPDYYEIVSIIPKEVLLSAFIIDKYIVISSNCEYEYWCN